MSLLAQQLGQLHAQSAIRIAPGAPKPTFILDQNTARNTTIDVLYTMALMGYKELKKDLLPGAKEMADLLLSAEYKQVNRNKLSQPQNKDLSIKLTRFLLLLSPWFLNRGCQSIIQYLLRNFHIHVFEAEQLILIYIQYWQHGIYTKLIENVQVKKPHLSFIKQLQEGKQINLTYIVKSLTYSRSLLESLIMFTKRYIREQANDSQDIDVDILVTKPTSYQLQTEICTLVKHDPKQFLLQILGEVMNRKINSFNKEIYELCVYASKEQNSEVRSMSMMLTLCMLSNQSSHNLWVNKVLTNLLKNDEIDESLFNFMMVIWQRWPRLLNNQIIEQLLQKDGFVSLIKQFNNSVYMQFFMLFNCYFQTNFNHKGIIGQILQTCVLKIKEEKFVKSHQNTYFNQLFTVFHQRINSIEKKEIKFIQTFVKKNLQYQYAVFIDSTNQQPLTGILPEKSYINGRIDFTQITHVRMEVEEPQQKPQIQQIQSDDEEIAAQPQKQQRDSLLKVINSHSKRQYAAIDMNNPEIVKISRELIEGYYSGHSQISTQQKNRLLEFPTLFDIYETKNMNEDLQKHDYSTAMRFIIKLKEIDVFYNVLTKLASDPEAAADLLFRELCRQIIEKLADMAQDNYKSVVNMLSRLYTFYLKNKNPESTKQLNEMMIRLSQAVVKNGKSQGKFHKLISCHAKMLASLTLSQAHRQQYALSTYKRILSIFGSENNYFVLVGVIQILALKQKHNKQFGSFVERILIPYLRQQQQPYTTYYHFLQAISKLLVFTYHMTKEGTNHDNKDELINDMSYGVAKKLIVSFFGLISPKSKRNISRKVFLFLAVLFKSPEHSAMFEEMLSSITRKQELKVAAICSKIYSVLNTIFTMTTNPLKQSVDNAKSRLIKLFPLQLKIYVLGPLLPLEEVYKQLGNQLKSHSHKNFDSLSHFVDIKPHSLTGSWLKFITQAMKRGYLPKTQTVKSILSGEIQDISSFQLQFICAFTQYAKSQSLQVLDQIMSIALAQCSQPTEFSLAIIFCLVKNLKQYLQPYLDQMFKIAIQVEAKQIQEFLQGLTGILTPPALLELAKNNWKTVKNFKNFTLFLDKISNIVTFESIWKTNQNFTGRTLNVLVQQEESYEQLNIKQAEVFVNLSLKMNDNQLRKVLIDYVRWASEKTNSDSMARLTFNSRKNLLVNIFEKLSNKLGDLFTHFYGYIFEIITKDLEDMQVHKQTQNSRAVGKKDREVSEYSLHCSLVYAKSLMKTLMGLFSNDPANQFMDSVKFDILSPKIGNLFNLTGFGNQYTKFIAQYLRPCLICLYVNTKDDYKLKSLNTEILRLLKTKDQRISAAIYGFFERVIDEIEHRFLLFTDQLIPLLVEASNSRNQSVKKSVENIIYKIQNLSGQKIESYIR